MYEWEFSILAIFLGYFEEILFFLFFDLFSLSQTTFFKVYGVSMGFYEN